MGTLEMYAICPLSAPVRILVSRILLFKDKTFNLVALHNLGAFKFRIRIIVVLIFKSSLYGRCSDRFEELRNLVGISTA